MGPDRALGELELLLLFALVDLGDDAYGVSVRDLIESETGRVLSPGSVYTGYERLERRGLVTSRLGEPTAARGGRPKRHYALSPKGARLLRESYTRLAKVATPSRVARLAALSWKGAR